MSDENGIRQTPFSDAWATPDTGGTGLNGIGGGFDVDGGPNGITRSPFKDAMSPPGTGGTADNLGGPYRDTIDVPGGSPKGSQLENPISNTRNTIDKR